MEIYIANEVAGVIALHPYLTSMDFKSLPIHEQIAMQAKTLHEAHKAGDKRIAMHVGSWWPDTSGKSIDELLKAEFTIADAELTMSREYGFSNFDAVKALGSLTTNLEFEQVVDEMLSGNILALEGRLKGNSDLAKARSKYGHQSTLLHYLGANGVESHRQVMPLNVVDIAQLLISYDADIRAEANMYGGGQTPHSLASTSAHPHNAGVSDALNLVLGGGWVG